MSDLKERLRSRKSVYDHYGNAGTILVNPDGESAIARIEELEAKLLEIAEAAFYEGFAEGRDGTWVEGDPSHAWKESETYTKLEKLK